MNISKADFAEIVRTLDKQQLAVEIRRSTAYEDPGRAIWCERQIFILDHYVNVLHVFYEYGIDIVNDTPAAMLLDFDFCYGLRNHPVLQRDENKGVLAEFQNMFHSLPGGPNTHMARHNFFYVISSCTLTED